MIIIKLKQIINISVSKSKGKEVGLKVPLVPQFLRPCFIVPKKWPSYYKVLHPYFLECFYLVITYMRLVIKNVLSSIHTSLICHVCTAQAKSSTPVPFWQDAEQDIYSEKKVLCLLNPVKCIPNEYSLIVIKKCPNTHISDTSEHNSHCFSVIIWCNRRLAGEDYWFFFLISNILFCVLYRFVLFCYLCWN